MHELLRPANLLSLSRLPLGALVWVAPRNLAWVLGLMLLAGLTDVLDGWLARKLADPDAEPSRTGAWLDPLCDKAFVLLALGAVWVALRPPLWLLPLIAARELLQSPLIAAYLVVPVPSDHRRYDFRASLVGKATTTAQFAAVGAILLEHSWTVPLAALAGGLGVISTGIYIGRAVPHLRAEGGVSGVDEPPARDREDPVTGARSRRRSAQLGQQGEVIRGQPRADPDADPALADAPR